MITCQTVTKEHNGHWILVYSGWFKRYLVIDGEIQDSFKTSGYLYGRLSSGESVHAYVNFWWSKVNIEILQ